MKKIRRAFYCAVIAIFCLNPVAMVNAEGLNTAVSDNCSSIKEKLREVQRDDAKVRVALGSYYETVLTRFITPLNVRLVENNLSNAKLVENQNDFAKTRTVFSDDFINYQKELEELVGMDCFKEPEDFYKKLEKVRQKRKTMNQDVLKMRNLLSGHIKYVNELMKEVQ